MVGRTPAQIDRTFRVGEVNLSMDGITISGIKPESVLACQLFSGNKCGHDPKNLKFYVKPQGQSRRWHVLEEAIRTVNIAIKSPFDFEMFHGLLFHANGRSIRSERLEGELRILLPALYDTVNLVNMECGFVNDKGIFVNFDYDHFVDVTGMNRSRVERNMRRLQDAGVIEVEAIRKKLNDEDRWVTVGVKIRVLEKAFTMLNLTDKLLEDRRRSLKNRAKLDARIDQKKKSLDLFRPTRKKAKATESAIKNILNYRKPPKSNHDSTRGVKIKARYEQLEYKGYSKEDIIRIIKDEFPPPPS